MVTRVLCLHARSILGIARLRPRISAGVITVEAHQERNKCLCGETLSGLGSSIMRRVMVVVGVSGCQLLFGLGRGREAFFGLVFRIRK